MNDVRKVIQLSYSRDGEEVGSCDLTCTVVMYKNPQVMERSGKAFQESGTVSSEGCFSNWSTGHKGNVVEKLEGEPVDCVRAKHRWSRAWAPHLLIDSEGAFVAEVHGHAGLRREIRPHPRE